MTTEHQNSYRQIYYSKEDPGILSRTASMKCVIMRRGMLTGGFDTEGELLFIYYSGYKKEKPVWDLDFFEPLFSQEPYQGRTDKITTVYILSDRELVSPESLFDERDAANWCNAFLFIEGDDVIDHFRLPMEDVVYSYAFPLNIKELVKINCKNVTIKPLASYMLNGSHNNAVHVQAFLSHEQACLSLHHYNSLIWHKVFDYANGEDIAYQIHTVCLEHKIAAEKATIFCNIMSPTEYNAANDLSQYFASIYTGTGKPIVGIWDSSISLMKQLYTCA